uniref:Homeobox domain-containing protein n=1 Tax=Panagrolaimus sp. JU765 TaxID=591449 RepID=A0AC34Q1P5_9BILA
MNSQNKRMLKLLTDFRLYSDEKIPFTVTSISNPETVVCSGELTYESPEKIVSENVAEFVKVMNPDYSIHYSRQLLDDWFPRTENYDPFERVKTINKTLGTNIVVIKPEMLEERFISAMGLAAGAARVVISPPIPAQNARQNSRSRAADGGDDGGNSAGRPRLFFTNIQKRTLLAIYEGTQRPSLEMQQTIAEHLRLDMSTVSNFFERRRSRNGSVVDDEPAPFQQFRALGF